MTQASSAGKAKARKVRAFTIDEETIQQISEIAELENRSLSNTVETALKQWASDRSKKLSLL